MASLKVKCFLHIKYKKKLSVKGVESKIQTCYNCYCEKVRGRW